MQRRRDSGRGGHRVISIRSAAAVVWPPRGSLAHLPPPHVVDAGSSRRQIVNTICFADIHATLLPPPAAVPRLYTFLRPPSSASIFFLFQLLNISFSMSGSSCHSATCSLRLCFALTCGTIENKGPRESGACFLSREAPLGTALAG